MIIWGTKAVYRHLGYVADFCPICVGARAFSLERIGMAGHIYYITAGEGELAGYQRNCLSCNILLRGDPERYAAFAKRAEALPALIKQTFPRLVEFHKDRLLLEHQVRTALPTLSEETRRSLIMEPFLLLSPKVVKYFAESHFEMGQTFMRREIIPVLGETLARLRPTEAELKAALTRLAQLRDAIGSRVKLADLMADLNQRGAQAPAPGATTFGTSDWADPPAQAARRAHPAGRRAGGALRPHEKAARLLKILAWLCAVGWLLIGAKDLFAPMDKEHIIAHMVIIAATAGMFLSSAAILRRAAWGRVVGSLYGVFLLAGFPIGTLIGGYLLWNLVMGWGEDDVEPEFA